MRAAGGADRASACSRAASSFQTSRSGRTSGNARSASGKVSRVAGWLADMAWTPRSDRAARADGRCRARAAIWRNSRSCPSVRRSRDANSPRRDTATARCASSPAAWRARARGPRRRRSPKAPAPRRGAHRAPPRRHRRGGCAGASAFRSARSGAATPRTGRRRGTGRCAGTPSASRRAARRARLRRRRACAGRACTPAARSTGRAARTRRVRPSGRGRSGSAALRGRMASGSRPVDAPERATVASVGRRGVRSCPRVRPDTGAGRVGAHARRKFRMTARISAARRRWHGRCLMPPASDPSELPTMIRDTSAQDRRIEPTPARRRWLVPGAAGAVVLLALVSGLPTLARLLSAGASASAAGLRIAEVRRGTLTRDISAQGKVVAAASPTLYTTAAGTVTFLVHAGDKVEQDEVLAEVDSPELTNKLAQERSTLDSLELEVERADIDNRQKLLAARKLLDQAGIDRQTAVRDLERNTRGYALGAIAEINVLRAKDALAKAELDVAHAEQDAKLLGERLAFELKTKRLARERQRLLVAELQRQVDRLKVRAPVAGQVGQLLVPQRANVAANTGLLTVVDLSALEVELPVPEVFAHDLSIGMPAEILDHGQTYRGEVSAVSPEVVNGQVVARVRFGADKPAGLRQSQQLTTRILIDERPNVLLVERGSFVDAGGGRVAYVVRNGVAERTAIRLGATSLNAVEIVAGVKEGDRIVISGTDAFNGAQRIVLN